MSESWRPVAGYEGLYEVSDHGRVKSLRRRGTLGGLLRATPDSGGYPTYRLCRDGKHRTFRAHQLVMLTFVGPMPDGATDIRHLDDVKTNNHVDNLAYGTRSENEYDKVRFGKHHLARKTHCPQGHPYDEANTARIPSRSSRYCRTCQADQRNKRRARQRAAGMRVT